jgi:aryl-alcohol dehydrogenase-like predicted oxidoreductase
MIPMTLLGKSGLRVSRLCLGTMTFGTEWGWGVDDGTARNLMDRYVEAGGNFIDTADGYTNGTSEKIIGAWMKERTNRDRVVVATKYTFNAEKGNANAGGNGRKNLHRALEGSLKRLGTDYVDLFWVHAWDALTPIEETMRSLDDVVRSGKARYVGFSDVPAWVASRGQTLAQLRGCEPLVALQLEYSLIERNIEREHVPMAVELGMGITPWSPLGSGMLTGKHKPGATHANVEGEGRLKKFEGSTHPAFAKLYTERNWRIVDTLRSVASELGRSMAQVAIHWATHQRGMTSTIIGATKLEQLDDNLRALDFTIPSALWTRLDEVSRPELVHPYMFFTPAMQSMMSGGVDITP